MTHTDPFYNLCCRQLHFALLAFCECCELALQNILTFEVPLKESVVKTIINSPVHVWTFYVGHIHPCCWLWLSHLTCGMAVGVGGGRKMLQDLPHVPSLIAFLECLTYGLQWGNWSGPLCKTLG